MDFYNTFSIITVLAALFGYINYRFLKFPNTIGVMIIALVISLIMIIAGVADPTLFAHTREMIRSVDFYTLVMKVMLSFLLFAGSIHIHIHDIRKERNADTRFLHIRGFVVDFYSWRAFVYCLRMDATAD